jgi:hypothetical protein
MTAGPPVPTTLRHTRWNREGVLEWPIGIARAYRGERPLYSRPA